MSLETYRSMQAAGDPGAQRYLEAHFPELYAEAIAAFATAGWLAIGASALMVLAIFAAWFHLRRHLPWRWAWLLPIAGFTTYATLKATVVHELIRLAPELTGMWSLYFKTWTPFRMVRTPLLGLLLTAAAIAVAARYGKARRSR